jgi:hypothetical protein
MDDAEKERLMNSNENAFDDFTAISGIGPARQIWLRDTFGIHTYQELAELTVSQIESKLKAEGKIVSRKAIESWIDQARDLMPESAASEQVKERPVAGELAERLNSAGHRNGWEPFASFLVYFQTREKDQDQLAYRTLVHYMEEDRETSWPGIEVRGISAWMLGQISDLVDLPKLEEREEVEQPAPASPKAVSLPEIKIDQVRVFQPATADAPAHHLKAGQAFVGELERDRPFRLVVDIGLTGEAAGELAEQGLICLARCYEYDSRTRASALLSESPPLGLERGKLDYTFEIPDASLPHGDYRMWVVVTTMQTDLLAPDFLELPGLKVS